MIIYDCQFCRMLRCSVARISVRFLTGTQSLGGNERKGTKGGKIIRQGGWKRIKFNPNYYPEHSTGNPLDHWSKQTWQRNPKVANNAHNVAKFSKEHKDTKIVRIYDEEEGERYYSHNHWRVRIYDSQLLIATHCKGVIGYNLFAFLGAAERALGQKRRKPVRH